MSITEKRLADIRARLDAATHEFLPVNGHPDDDECTNRADGTDNTYCGEPEAAHDVIPEECSRDLADLLAEVKRLRAQTTVDDAMVERAARAILRNTYGGNVDLLSYNAWDIARSDARAALAALLGGGDDA